MRLLFFIGILLLGLAMILARHAGNLEDRLRQHQLRKVAFTQFGGQPMDAYRPPGWPILIRLRWTLAGVHASAIVGIWLMIYAYPQL